MSLATFQDRLESVLAFRQPRLAVAIEEGKVIAEGELVVAPMVAANTDIGALATYQVRIEFDPTYPDVAPVVMETGGAIVRSDSFHINPDGTCCILVWETWRATAPDTSIAAYVDGPLRNYFLSQRSVALGGDWPFGEWAHGAQGLVTAYAERLGCRVDEKIVLTFLKRLQAAHRRQGVPGHWLCLCGSQRMIGGCCRSKLELRLGTIDAGKARSMYERLSEQASIAQKKRRRP